MKIPRVDVPRVLSRGSVFFSFLIGFGIAVLFLHRPYIVEPVLAVPPETLTTTVSKHDGKCYRYRVEDASCHFSSTV
jgi:hypothetical protein